jgi:hypothetical protein
VSCDTNPVDVSRMRLRPKGYSVHECGKLIRVLSDMIRCLFQWHSFMSSPDLNNVNVSQLVCPVIRSDTMKIVVLHPRGSKNICDVGIQNLYLRVIVSLSFHSPHSCVGMSL